jgi:DNA-binding NarL/FixJ family response regulator
MIRLALVDDHNMFREGLKAIILSFNDMEVVLECENGRDFLNNLSEGVDVVLLDVEMPKLNGMQVMEELHQKKSAVKIIFISQVLDSALISRMMELGARGFLSKDAETKELQNAILSVHETGYFFNDIVSQSMLIKLANKEHINPSFNRGEQLTEREQAVLKLICEAHTSVEIGEKLCISPKTVENHRSKILEKTGARNSAGLVVYAIKNNLVDVGKTA